MRKTKNWVTAGIPPCENGLTYIKKCRCRPCTDRKLVYNARWRKVQAEKRWGVPHSTDRLDPADTVALVRHANIKLGLTYKEISRITGMTDLQVRRLATGDPVYVTRKTYDTVAKHFSLEDTEPRFRSYRDSQLIPHREWRWRIDCLMAQSWGFTELQTMLRDAGRPWKFMENLITGNSMKRIHYDQVVWLADQIQDARGTSPRLAARMLRLGKYPLIHYTDDGKLIRESVTQDQVRARKKILYRYNYDLGRKNARA